MNTTPDRFILVAPEDLETFVGEASRSVGLPVDKADLLASLLIMNDLGGNFSHGTRQITTYARRMRDGVLNSNPNIRVTRETPCSLMVDGDGGLGHFPAHEGTIRVIDKAKQTGIAVMVSCNHGHIGAAGTYARMPLEHDLMSFVTSGHQLKLVPDQLLYRAAGGSPMAFSAPAGGESPLVLDFGTMHDLYADDQHRDKVAELTPGLVLRSIGMGEICQAWGGLLSGLSIDAGRPAWSFSGASQGALVIIFRIDLFADPERFKNEMDDYVQRVGRMKPLPGFDRAFLAGGAEAAREAEFRLRGIPVGDKHRKLLEELGNELGIEVPW